jgi:hypothetical protein
MKKIAVHVRDMVGNEDKADHEASIYFQPLVEITIFDISTTTIEQTKGRRVCHFKFTANIPFIEWQIAAVENEDDVYSESKPIIQLEGSEGYNMYGREDVEVDETVVCGIDARDLLYVTRKCGHKIIKIFVRDVNGNWSKMATMMVLSGDFYV